MATINVKIVGVDGDSVLVKYATENSAKNIDEYDAVAYQPASMGYSNVNDFIDSIKLSLLATALQRDALEQSAAIDLSSWVGVEQSHDVLDNLVGLVEQSSEVIL